jgi:CxxC-x17-CxxC domain-containing protein
MGYNNNRDRFSGRRSDRPTMHDAVCDKCGKSCQVPFRPSGDKPIFCSQCFEQEGGGSRGNDRRSSNRRSFRPSGDREMFTAICDDCGKECKVPFSPSKEKPIYCSECFEKRGSGNTSKGCDCKQLDEIVEKLDRILLALETKEKVVEKKVVKKKVATKKKVAKK